MVVRSIVQAISASVVSQWYKSNGGNVKVWDFFGRGLVRCFGSAVFASIFVDVFGLISWLLIRLHILMNGKNSQSKLRTIAEKMEEHVNSGCYAFIIAEQMEFIPASSAASNLYRGGLHAAVRSTTVKYHSFFVSLQCFALVFASTAHMESAVVASLLTWCFTSVFHASTLALLVSYAANPKFLQEIDNSLATQIQKKILPDKNDKEENKGQV
eukprot:TRINITY_DN4060_c0_g1_i2.p1 TRINITY_DN4060_c0_g1~~TRINITY_DN4060_c0_g1_i2.p1  ORF type:complete len:213 (-),score=53.55 TRINITY_DN4060_c0_g1_i2:80-718(-)